jgi:AraC family transcriptional regulator
MLHQNLADPVDKALWYIELHLEEDVALDAVAEAAGVSKFHISRAFGIVTGRSVMRYVRGRRLTEAARALQHGVPEIVDVALQSGYGSHEAFTRAFRDQFGITPESLRAQRKLDGIALVEPLRRDHFVNSTLEPPRIERGHLLLLAGLSQRFSYDGGMNIPLLWQRFTPYIGHVPGQTGDYAYGAMFNSDSDGLDYMAAVEVTSFDDFPEELQRLRIPEQQYAVFGHRDHVSTIRNTMKAIWSSWLPQSGYTAVDAPGFERYGSDFDTVKGTGTIEIFIPIL